MRNLGAALKERRKELGLTQERVAENYFGVERQAYSVWERGARTTLDLDFLKQVADYLGTDELGALIAIGWVRPELLADAATFEGHSGPFHWTSTAVFAEAEQLELDGNVLDLDAKGEVIEAADRFRQASPPEPEDGAAAGQVAA